MSSRPKPNPAHESHPTSISIGAVENLRYIRSTIEAANTFTTVPGRGCVAMAILAFLAAGIEMSPGMSAHWLPLWLGAAALSCVVAIAFMRAKARAEGLSLNRSVCMRFFLTLAPAFVAGAVLTAALADTVERGIIGGVWLLLYGTGIAACGVFSIPAVLAAGFGFMGLGTIGLFAPAAWAPGLLALGFGGIHLALGIHVIRNHGG